MELIREGRCFLCNFNYLSTKLHKFADDTMLFGCDSWQKIVFLEWVFFFQCITLYIHRLFIFLHSPVPVFIFLLALWTESLVHNFICFIKRFNCSLLKHLKLQQLVHLLKSLDRKLIVNDFDHLIKWLFKSFIKKKMMLVLPSNVRIAAR